jgi:AcrR family transcriptional regulator
LTAAEDGPRDVLLERIIGWFAVHGVLDTSLRTLAAELGTSNRMLNYHFGSREQLLAAVIDRVSQAERRTLEVLMDGAADPVDACRDYWNHVVETAGVFAPLFYELSAHAMYGKEYATGLGRALTDAWLDSVRHGFSRVTDTQHAEDLARLCVAVGRGMLFEVALTSDRDAATAAVERFCEMLRTSLEKA